VAILTTSLQIGQTLKSAGRLKTIVSVFARHGFQNVAERAKLGQFLLRNRQADPDLERLTAPVRVRMAFEQLGPTFVKLGQLLASRPDLIPQEYVEEFKRLHDNVRPVAWVEIETVLSHQYGNYQDIFLSFSRDPVASASIAQVHQAVLKDGSNVVVKIRRPGIIEVIEDDVGVLETIVALLDRYVPESKVFNPKGIVEEFFKTLRLETNFIVEANNTKRFALNFKNQPKVKIPKVHEELSGEAVIVMEALQGTPISRAELLPANAFDKDEIVKLGLGAFFKMVFTDRFFHGDLHAGNFFILPGNEIGLIDFGVVGRLSERVRTCIADMLVALSQEDYEGVAYAYLEISDFRDEVDMNRFARDLRDLISPFYGLTFKNMNAGKLLMDSTRLAARHGLQVPSELMLFFKGIVTVEGMARVIIDDFDVLASSLQFATEIVKAKYDPERMIHDLANLARDSTSLIYSLPREIKQLLRKLNSSDRAWKIQIEHFEDFKRSFESSANLLFLGMIIGSLVIGASLTVHLPDAATFLGVPVLTSVFLGLAVVTGVIAFINYIRK
jgi:ubiquinone biosynthesis protein